MQGAVKQPASFKALEKHVAEARAYYEKKNITSVIFTSVPSPLTGTATPLGGARSTERGQAPVVSSFQQLQHQHQHQHQRMLLQQAATAAQSCLSSTYSSPAVASRNSSFGRHQSLLADSPAVSGLEREGGSVRVDSALDSGVSEMHVVTAGSGFNNANQEIVASISVAPLMNHHPAVP